MKFAFFVFFPAWPVLCWADVNDLPQPTEVLVIGGQYEQELTQEFNASWSSVTLREILQGISRAKKISFLLDRRVDPSQIRPVSIEAVPLHVGISQLAEQFEAKTAYLRNGLYIGPASSADKLRTLIQLRSDELKAKDRKVSKLRRTELNGHHLLKWDNLEEPTAILQGIANRYDLELQGIELVPHDLWATATLPRANSAEAISVVLIQFDLTFRWLNGGKGIQIVPVPEHVELERKYVMSKSMRNRKAIEWSKRFPTATIVDNGQALVVTASWEEHAEIKRLRRQKSPKPVPRKSASLLNEKFTLRVSKVPANALIEKLRSSGVKIEFNEGKLDAAGIDLAQRVSLDLDQVSTAELFKAICEPLGLEFKLEANRVELFVPSNDPEAKVP